MDPALWGGVSVWDLLERREKEALAVEWGGGGWRTRPFPPHFM